MDDIRKLLPDIYKRSRLMQAICTSENGELHCLHDVCEAAFKEMLIDTATETLSAYEKSLCITPDVTATPEQRRSNIKAKMRGYGTLTTEQLKEIIASYAKGDVEIIEHFSDYKISIKFINRIGRPDNLADVKKVVSDVIPAHIMAEYVFIYNTWQTVGGSLTWGEAKEKTWDDLLNEVITDE